MYVRNRLAVNIDEDTVERITYLTTAKGINVTTAVRRAFGLYYEVVTRMKSGWIVEFVNKDEGKREELVLL